MAKDKKYFLLTKEIFLKRFVDKLNDPPLRLSRRRNAELALPIGNPTFVDLRGR